MNIGRKIEKLYSMMQPCSLCPRQCGALRNEGQKGLCKTADKIFVASSGVHMGEEPPISGTRGSGTIFFSNCAMNCVFCQNYPISQYGNGREISLDDLVASILKLQDRGVHNINFVTPTHYSAHAAEAVFKAKSKGLEIPVLWNTSGYENYETLRLLEGTVDIYLPDIKYADDVLSFKYSGVKNYVETNRRALIEMKRQVGDLQTDAQGIARKGIIIRHMVLPGNAENTKQCLDFIAGSLSAQTRVSLMSQYHKAYKSETFAELSKGLSYEEYDEAVSYLESLGFTNGWIQELEL
ncbi:MAG: radical SAM protein [Endomicrobium sp.]|jgi:putative pyruvate formate lyase activating enzyme|nr:radical SAM protein [Endomicrobium sp.]